MNDIQEDWACETKRKKFSTPYNMKEKLGWIKNNLFGPSKKFRKLIDFIPQIYKLNKVSPKISLIFIGDIMKMGKRRLEFDLDLINFFKNADYLIGNFEGTISEGKGVFMAQKHSKNIIND